VYNGHGTETSGEEFESARLAHQSLTSTAQTYLGLSADIQLVSEHGRRHLRSSSYRRLAVPRTRTTLGDRSFAVAGPATIKTDYQLWTVLTASKTFIYGLEIAAHCDS